MTNIETGTNPATPALQALRAMRIHVESAGNAIEDAIGEAKALPAEWICPAGKLVSFENELRDHAECLATLLTDIDAAITAAEAQAGS